MNHSTKIKLLKQIVWDYNISGADIEAVLNFEKPSAGHLTRGMIFQRILESYPWFTILQIFTPDEVRGMLSDEVIGKLRVPSLRTKYEFVRRRLQEIIPAAG